MGNHGPAASRHSRTRKRPESGPSAQEMQKVPRMTDTTWDVIVVGGGPAGETAAGECARRGLSTSLVETERFGGECSYWACVPSKVLLRPLEVAWESAHVPALAGALQGRLDVTALMRTRDEAISGLDDAGQVEWVENAGITPLRGRGRLVGERRVEIEAADGQRTVHEARRAVILSTGSRPRLPPVPGLEDAKPWTNREGTHAGVVPGRLVVIGAGPVACELAQAWSGLGAQVTLLVRGDALLTRMEPFVGEQILERFRAGGIDVRLSTEARKVMREQDGTVRLALSDGSELEADALLVATGRKPATDGLGLESVGVDASQPVEVDDRLRVRGAAGDWLYAVGDVNGRTLLTHMGKYQGWVAAAVIAGEDSALRARDAIPQVLFTHPQAASVGLTLERARRNGLRARATKVPFSSAAGTQLMGKGLKGEAQLVIDEEREVLVGATFIGPFAGELLHGATIAVVGEVPLSTLWHAVPSFPTVSEVWLRLLEADRDREG